MLDETIDLNTEKRKEATMRGDKAGKDLFKYLIMQSLARLWRIFGNELISR